MFDFSKPISIIVILYSIGFIIFLVIIGLIVVEYYKKKLNNKK